MFKKIFAITVVGAFILSSCTETLTKQQTIPTYKQTTEIPEGITTPDNVSTSIGELKFLDGAPLPETAELVYENLDRMRGVDVFLKGVLTPNKLDKIFFSV